MWMKGYFGNNQRADLRKKQRILLDLVIPLGLPQNSDLGMLTDIKLDRAADFTDGPINQICVKMTGGPGIDLTDRNTFLLNTLGIPGGGDVSLDDPSDKFP